MAIFNEHMDKIESLLLRYKSLACCEDSILMVMAIVGGGIVSAVLGVAQSSFGSVGIVATLGAYIAYLFALGLFASPRRSSVE